MIIPLASGWREWAFLLGAAAFAQRSGVELRSIFGVFLPIDIRPIILRLIFQSIRDNGLESPPRLIQSKGNATRSRSPVSLIPPISTSISSRGARRCAKSTFR